MNSLICTTISCLTLLSSPTRVEIKSNDSLLYNNGDRLIHCTYKENFYNCNTTNNLFNPIDN